MQNRSFARSHAMFALIAAAMSLPTQHAQQAALSAIAPYKSRGKGRSKGNGNQAPHGKQMAHIRAAKKARNVRRHRAAQKG